ncbi:hydrogenase maturation protease [Actinoplanes sp. NPDC024001]|uniref:hydrogenase maturation protease n=1 Tax=Actinoplanes sp. NPDC024001 TaxID=3154598 RepID=UPI0033D9B90B
MNGVLVAGIGNLFLGDDGFGPAVARRLAAEPGLPADVRVVDYGIRGLHLAHDLLAGFRALVLVDALPPGPDPPGTVLTLSVRVPGAQRPLDAHGMDPLAVLDAVERLGGTVPPAYVVGCRVADVGERIGLSPSVAAAVPHAVTAVRTLLAAECTVGGR